MAGATYTGLTPSARTCCTGSIFPSLSLLRPMVPTPTAAFPAAPYFISARPLSSTPASKPSHLPTPPFAMACTIFWKPNASPLPAILHFALGSGQHGACGRVLLYCARELLRWEFRHALAQGESTGLNTLDPFDAGDMWEC